MLVKCSLCGGESLVEPGEAMLVCSYCGAALALDEPRGPEHLILMHKRNDAAAEEALRSFLVEMNRNRPGTTATELSYLPFSLNENADGTAPVTRAFRCGSMRCGAPYPPAGDYRFFEESCAAGESIVPADNVGKETTTILHLPVYRIRYETEDWRGDASVIGESWQVMAEELPPEKSRALNIGALLGAVGLFTLYFVIGKLTSNLIGRMALIAAASAGGYLLFSFHEKVSRQR